MPVTLEPVTAVRAMFGVDRLGYTFCGACVLAGSGTDAPLRLREVDGSVGSDDLCEGCRRYPAHWTPIEVSGTAWIEHTPARIF